MKKNLKMTALALCICLVCASFSACAFQGNTTAATQATVETVPSPEPGLVGSVTADGLATLYLPPEFEIVNDEIYTGRGWQIAAQSKDVLILGAREDEALFASSDREFPASLEEYIAFLEEVNNFSKPFAKDSGGSWSTTYEGTFDDRDMYFYVAVFPVEGAYWMIHFACPVGDTEKYADSFPYWASLLELK